jgi:hypothetical protein
MRGRGEFSTRSALELLSPVKLCQKVLQNLAGLMTGFTKSVPDNPKNGLPGRRKRPDVLSKRIPVEQT